MSDRSKRRMHVVNRNRCLIGLLVGGSALMAPATSALADTAANSAPVNRSAALLTIGSGRDKTLGRPAVEDAVDPNTNRRAGPGFEQSTIAHIVGADKAHYIVLIVMQSPEFPRADNLGPYQMSCSSFKLNEKSSPTQVVSNKWITQNPGDRSANHPKAIPVSLASGQNVVAYTYGSQMGTNRTKTYFSVVDEMCNKILPDTKISSVINETNNDRGAADLVSHGIVNGAARMSFGYFSNGTDKATYFGAIDLSDATGILAIKSLYEPVMVLGPTNIGRAAMAANGGDRALLCAASGSQNRPEPNVQCAHMNVSTGATIWKDNVATGVMDNDPYKRKYFGQPTIAPLGDGTFAISVLESNGAARNIQRNLKGSNTAHLLHTSINPGTEALVVGGELVGAAVHQTHSAICTGKFGVDKKPTVAVVSASPTGIGRAALLTVHVDAKAVVPFSYDLKQDAWPLNFNGDSGFLANMYGDNPGNQGRDFMRCVGDIPNPGHGVAGGFMSDVSSFFAAAIPGREVGNPKNSLYLSLLPAETDTVGTPGNPLSANDVPTLTTMTPDAQNAAPTGCACNNVGARPATSTFGGLGLFGLTVLGLRRIRRRSAR